MSIVTHSVHIEPFSVFLCGCQPDMPILCEDGKKLWNDLAVATLKREAGEIDQAQYEEIRNAYQAHFVGVLR